MLHSNDWNFQGWLIIIFKLRIFSGINSPFFLNLCASLYNMRETIIYSEKDFIYHLAHKWMKWNSFDKLISWYYGDLMFSMLEKPSSNLSPIMIWFWLTQCFYCDPLFPPSYSVIQYYTIGQIKWVFLGKTCNGFFTTRYKP